MPARRFATLVMRPCNPAQCVYTTYLLLCLLRCNGLVDHALCVLCLPGFAEGLARPATLVVGDLSFLHDINGLCMLRAGEARPPLTVVLINNGGGGIFSFLPIAGVLPKDTFTPLWETPQNVDLEGEMPLIQRGGMW